MGKKKQDAKAGTPAPKKNFIDNLKFMQLAKDAPHDRKNKHRRREEPKQETAATVDTGNDESLPFFFKRVQAVARQGVEVVENKRE